MLKENTSKLLNLSLSKSDSKSKLAPSSKHSSGRKRNLRYDKVSSPVGDYIRGISPTVKKSKVQSFGPIFPGSPMLPSAYSESGGAYSSPRRHSSAPRRHSDRRKSSARRSIRGGSSQKKKHTPSSLSRPILASAIMSNENANMSVGNSPLQGKIYPVKAFITSAYHCLCRKTQQSETRLVGQGQLRSCRRNAISF